MKRNMKTKQLACKDCGTPIIAATNTRKRCTDCAYNHRLAQQARYRAGAKDRERNAMIERPKERLQ